MMGQLKSHKLLAGEVNFFLSPNFNFVNNSADNSLSPFWGAICGWADFCCCCCRRRCRNVSGTLHLSSEGISAKSQTFELQKSLKFQMMMMIRGAAQAQHRELGFNFHIKLGNGINRARL
jgi:hypothetical protein